MRILQNSLHPIVINVSVLTGLDNLLHTCLLFLLIPNSTALASTSLDMGITIALLCKCLPTMFAVERLCSSVYADVVHDVAYFEELSTACDTYQHLIRTTCDEVVSENLYIAFGEILVKLIALEFNRSVFKFIICHWYSVLILRYRLRKLTLSSIWIILGTSYRLLNRQGKLIIYYPIWEKCARIRLYPQHTRTLLCSL